jgi:hypothetical protein
MSRLDVGRNTRLLNLDFVLDPADPPAHGHNARRQRTVEFPPTPLLRPAHRDETREQPVTTAPASCTRTDARSSFPSEFTPGALREFD